MLLGYTACLARFFVKSCVSYMPVWLGGEDAEWAGVDAVGDSPRRWRVGGCVWLFFVCLRADFCAVFFVFVLFFFRCTDKTGCDDSDFVKQAHGNGQCEL